MAVLVVWGVIILRRAGPTLWKGASLAVVNFVTVLVSTIAVGFTPAVIVFDVALIVIAFVVRDSWLLLGINQPDSAEILERCFTQTRAAAARRGDVYAISCGGAEMTVSIRPTIGRIMNVRFIGGTGSKKALLLRNLFCKQFHPSLPTPRFRA